MSEKQYFVGVDVGTVGVRAALFSDTGELVTHCDTPLVKHNPRYVRYDIPPFGLHGYFLYYFRPDYYMQSSAEIWSKLTRLVKEVVTKSGVDKRQIRGVGFTATCSLVVVGKDDDEDMR